jgi:hypothetical protein
MGNCEKWDTDNIFLHDVKKKVHSFLQRILLNVQSWPDGWKIHFHEN